MLAEDENDPFILWLCFGGFLYLDYKYDICAVNAVSLASRLWVCVYICMCIHVCVRLRSEG